MNFLTITDCQQFQTDLERMGYPVAKARYNLLKSILGDDVQRWNFGSQPANSGISNMPEIVAREILAYAKERGRLAGGSDLRRAKAVLKLECYHRIMEGFKRCFDG